MRNVKTMNLSGSFSPTVKEKLVPKRPPHLPHHHHRPGATGGGVGKPRKPPPFLRQQGQGNRGPKTPGVGDATPSSILPGVGSGSQGTLRPKHSSRPVPTQLPPGRKAKRTNILRKCMKFSCYFHLL